MDYNKQLSPIVTELFFRDRKTNISLVFISLSYLKMPKTIILNTIHYFIMKIPNKRELQQIGSSRSSDIDFKNFMKIDDYYTKEPYLFIIQLCNQIIH